MNCLECGEKIVGRIDKKFCDDSCRNAYNNRRNKDSSNYMRTVNAKLRKNHRILSTLNFTEGKTKITLERLQTQGFDPEYFTRFRTYKNGSEYRFIYDIGFKLLENNWLLVVKKDMD